jgi:two-component system LytT family response regulator
MTVGWRVLVADDEPAARRGVRQLLAAFPAFAVVGEARHGAELLAQLDRLRPDLVFLDVQMPGIGGFEAIRRRTPERMPTVVFLTAYEEHALAAFEAHAFDYLVKPVTAERFARTIDRLERLRATPGAPSREPTVVVTTPRGHRILPLREVDWIESADNYVRVWIGARSWLVRESLGSLEQRTAAHGFRRAHRTALVRIDAVVALLRTPDGPVAELRSGALVPISRRRHAEFTTAARRR